MKYQDGFKYQLAGTVKVQIPVYPSEDIDTQFIKLSRGGVLTILTGYAWDGPSGPTFDTANFMRGSLVHDALYELMRKQLLSIKWRKPADRIMQRICIEDGMTRARAWWVYTGLQIAGGEAALPGNKKPILEAP